MMRKLVLSTATTLGFNVGSKRASLQFGVILFVLLLLAPISGAYALALADIELSSRLNEPLNARIPLRAFLATDMQTIQAGLADDRHFSRAGLERSSILSLLQFTTIRNQDGSAYIRITTDAPIDESFLSFIVEVNWSRGRILREYTLLLDPPVYVDTGSAMVAPIKEVAATADTTGAAKPSTSGSTPEKSTERVRVSSQSTSGRSDGTNVSTSKTFSQYGPVNARDTLWSIATRFRPNQSVSIEQVMLALQRYNPEAFSQNNINSLNAGAILRIPDLETITALSRTRALAEVDKQHVAWEDFRQKLAKSPVAAPEGSPVPDIKSKSDVADPKQSGRVEILSAGTAEEGVGHEGEENLKELRGQISLVKEELDAKSRENNDLRTRLAEAESLIQEFAHLMEIQSDEINALKTKLAQEKIESSIADPLTEFEQIQPGSIAQTPSMAPRTAPQEEGKILHEKGSGRLQLEPAKSIGLPSVSKIQAPVVEEQVMPKAEVPHAEPTGAGSAVGTLPSRINEWMDYIRDNLFVIAIVLGGIIVIFVVMASWLRARPTEEASDNGRTLDNSRVPNDGRAIDDSREFSDEPDTFLDSQPPATVHAVSPPDPGLSRAKSDRKHDSPPVESPDREPPPVRKKEPEKSEEIGEPVIFGGGDGEPVIPPAVDDPAQLIDNTPDNNIALDIGFGDDDDDDDVLSLEPDEANKNIGGRDLNAISNVAPEESDATMPPTPEWALDFAGPDLQEISPAETTDTQPITGENLDFNFGFDLDVEVSSESESPVGEGDNDQLFEFPPADTSGSIDEMQTKLDLAQAYIDMGDIEGARTILEKVLAEGEEKHKTLAKELLEKFD